MSTSIRAPHIVVVGFPQLAAELRRPGLFPSIEAPETTSALRDLVRSGALSSYSKNELVFIFSDRCPVDTDTTLDHLVGRLATAGWPVIVVAFTGVGSMIVESHPKAGLVPAPVTLNLMLAAISGLGLGYDLPPVKDGDTTLTSGGDTTLTSGENTQAPADRPVSAQQPSVQEKPVVMSGWRTPEPEEDAPAGPIQRPSQPVERPAQRPMQPIQRPARPDQPLQQPPQQPQRPLRPIQRPSGIQQPADMPFHRAVAPRVGTHSEYAPNRARPARRGYVIAVTSPKGGTGKSSVSMNLASFLGMSLRKAGKTVCLVDANFQQADAGKLLHTYTPNILDLYEETQRRYGGALSIDTVQRYMVHRENLNTSFLLGPVDRSKATPAFLGPDLYGNVLAALRQAYDYIIIDTPVAEYFHVMFRDFVLKYADYLLVLVIPAVHAVDNVASWLHTITSPTMSGGMDYPLEKIGIVLNQKQEGVGYDERRVRSDLASYQFLGSIPVTSAWLKALNNYELVVVHQYYEINAAFASILYQITGEPALSGQFNAVPTKRRRGIISRLWGS